MNSILWFFDLYSQSKHGGARAQAADGTEISNAVQWLIYGACLLPTQSRH